MQEHPLVSVGVPTYNRPEGLKRALGCITSQTYRNLEIIISDNASGNDLVRQVVSDFQETDSRISFFSQTQGIGIVNNFHFVLKKATGSYFIWAADDDEWQGTDFLEKLLKYASSNILVFPDAILVDEKNKLDHPLITYEGCGSNIDYTKVYCSDGIGYPFYGLYNLQLFNDSGLEFKWDGDLSYFQEGTFLHRMFLKGPVKYVKEAAIKFSTSSTKPSYDKLLNDFLEYFRRTILIYTVSGLNEREKKEVMNVIFSNYTSYLRNLVENNERDQNSKRINGMTRIKKAIKILITGNI
jgi:glycosyltransferase involved in cell wall biosynthesis